MKICVYGAHLRSGAGDRAALTGEFPFITVTNAVQR